MSGDTLPREDAARDEQAHDGETLLSVEGLRTVFSTDKEEIHAVDGVDFDVRAGETLGLVGESGSGKSVTARSVMGLVESPGRIAGGSIRYRGDELVGKSDDELRAYRGGDIAMIFQDPMTSLNPVYTVGNQITEALELHQGLTGREATDEAAALLEAVGIPDARRRLDEYPHQFSGGMRQRALIAMALACEPELLICDEPTTALDVTTQAQILDLLAEIQRERDLAMVFITHDMGVIAEVADRVAVMYAGEIVERAPVERLFADPKHPYTQGLLESIPGRETDTARLHTIDGDVPTATGPASQCRFAPRCPAAMDGCESVHPATVVDDADEHAVSCLLYPADRSESWRLDRHRADDHITGERHGRSDRPTGTRSTADASGRAATGGETLVEVENLETYYGTGGVRSSNPVKAVDGVSFEIRRGETLGLVGESGCGKTTLGRTLVRLETPTGGTVSFDGTDVTTLSGEDLAEWRKNAQIVFQDPDSSMNDRLTVGKIIREPLDSYDWKTPRERRARVRELLDLVGLQPEHYYRYPHQFSGGQRQRIGIARALALNPDFVVLDEPTSALDVSVQAKILNLLADLQDELGLTYLFIAHDLSVVRHICDRIAVMYLGNILEIGPTEQLFADPANPYTRTLLSAIPRPDPTADTERIPLDGSPPSPRNPPTGCPLSTRCPTKLRPDEFADCSDELWARVDVLRNVIRERERSAGTVPDRLRRLVGLDDPAAEFDELRGSVFGDVTVPGAVADALDETERRLAEGGERAAREYLRERFGSDCDAVVPDAHAVGDGRLSRCHRHREGEPEPAAVDEFE